jgi:hypothetical protein
LFGSPKRVPMIHLRINLLPWVVSVLLATPANGDLLPLLADRAAASLQVRALPAIRWVARHWAARHWAARHWAARHWAMAGP